MKYKASPLSEGNHICAKEIELLDNGVTVRVPSPHNGSSRFVEYSDIVSVQLSTPADGFSTITFHGAGTNIKAHGFTKTQAEAIKEVILRKRDL